jgi:predicted nicotinamide N-methyase
MPTSTVPPSLEIQQLWDSDLQRYPQRAFEFGGQTAAVLVDQWFGDVGFCVWDAEVILAHRLHSLFSCTTSGHAENQSMSAAGDTIHVAAPSSTSMRGIRLLELGAGAAIAAIVCARLGARATAQELTGERVAHARACAAMNGAHVRVCQGRWASDALHDELLGRGNDDFASPPVSATAIADATSSSIAQTPPDRRFDIVAMADVLYGDASEFDDLVTTTLASVRPGGTVFVSVEQRRRDIAPFFARMAAHFNEACVLRYDISRAPVETGVENLCADADSDVPGGGVIFLLECRGALTAAFPHA